jgi:hypothetical protein
MVPLRSVAGIEEYRIIQLVDGHTIGAATIFFAQLQEKEYSLIENHRNRNL